MKHTFHQTDKKISFYNTVLVIYEKYQSRMWYQGIGGLLTFTLEFVSHLYKY